MEHLGEIKTYTGVFAVSDYYAMDFIQLLFLRVYFIIITAMVQIGGIIKWKRGNW